MQRRKFIKNSVAASAVIFHCSQVFVLEKPCAGLVTPFFHGAFGIGGRGVGSSSKTLNQYQRFKDLQLMRCDNRQ